MGGIDGMDYRQLARLEIVQIDAEVGLLAQFMRRAQTWKAAAQDVEDGEPGAEAALLTATAEIAALRGRLVSVMLRGVARRWRAGGFSEPADAADTLAATIGFASLAMAKDLGLERASEE